jgi:hypothetical protein
MIFLKKLILAPIHELTAASGGGLFHQLYCFFGT